MSRKTGVKPHTCFNESPWWSSTTIR